MDMETNWAAEQLQTIRTLMERSAVYRRALAPIMTFCGVVGILGGVTGHFLGIRTPCGFVLFWFGVAAIASGGAFFLVRRQALKDSEPFWSPPTRRVTQAIVPSFFIGIIIGGSLAFWGADASPKPILILSWCWAYGCALHSAGFFMPHGVKWFGWIFILTGALLTGLLICEVNFISPHLLMAGIFGGLHLAYGIYLYFTENRKTAP
jgi:hypothetical protein